MKEFELEPGEVVVREVRKHWFIFLVELLPFAILALLPFAIPKLLMLFAVPVSFEIPWDAPTAHILGGSWLLFVWTGAFKVFTNYYLDLWVITTTRIVDINQRHFFNRQVSSLLLNRVQDVTIDTVGVIRSLLDIGDINVQSAGAVERFRMRGIPHPQTLRDVILKNVSEHPLPTAHV